MLYVNISTRRFTSRNLGVRAARTTLFEHAITFSGSKERRVGRDRGQEGGDAVPGFARWFMSRIGRLNDSYGCYRLTIVWVIREVGTDPQALLFSVENR